VHFFVFLLSTVQFSDIILVEVMLFRSQFPNFHPLSSFAQNPILSGFSFCLVLFIVGKSPTFPLVFPQISPKAFIFLNASVYYTEQRHECSKKNPTGLVGYVLLWKTPAERQGLNLLPRSRKFFIRE